MGESCCGGAHGAVATVDRRDRTAIAPVGVVSSTIAATAGQLRFRVIEDVVERRARALHARSSFDCWNALSDRDQELWRHMARLEIAGPARA